MRIAMITSSLASGVRTHIVQLCNHLASMGHDIFVIYSTRNDTREADPSGDFDAGVTLIQIQTLRDISLMHDYSVFRRYRKILRDIKPDVVHLHSSKAGALGRVACVGLDRDKTRVFYTPHGYAFLRRDLNVIHRAMLWMVESILGPLSETIVVSESEGLLAAGLGFGNKSRTHLLLNSVEEMDGAEYVGVSTRCIATSGRITFQKNPNAFINVAKGITDQDVDARFLWIGGGTPEEEEAFKMRVKAEGLGDKVNVTGWLTREDSLTVLRDEVSIYIHTSLWEGLSYSVLEAMSLGKPCIASDIESNREIITDGVNGLLASDAQGFIEKISALFKNPDLHKRVADSAKNTIRDRYSLQRMLEMYILLISENGS